MSCRIGTDNYEADALRGKAALDMDEEEIDIGIVNFDATTENGQSREKRIPGYGRKRQTYGDC